MPKKRKKAAKKTKKKAKKKAKKRRRRQSLSNLSKNASHYIMCERRFFYSSIGSASSASPIGSSTGKFSVAVLEVAGVTGGC